MGKKQSKSGRGFVLGIIFGLLLGIMTDNLALWIGPGIAFGWLIETMLNKKDAKKEEENA